MGKFINIEGMRRGSLEAVAPDGPSAKRGSRWRVKCHGCGAEYSMTRHHFLYSGSDRCKSCATREDLVGAQFGDLTVVEYGGLRRGKSTWWCRCRCGGIIRSYSAALKSGTAKTCAQCARTDTYNLYGRGYSVLYGMYRSGAKRRGISFSLSPEQFFTLVVAPCTYCGSEPRLRPINGSGSVLANGVDRVDSALPYTAENCVPCCSVCNVAKHTLSAEDYVAHCRQVARWNDGYACDTDRGCRCEPTD